MKYFLAVMLMCSISFALINESFRYQSTAGLFEDDYDLLFDPARILEISGSRLWTSLSNFVTGDEELFSNGSVPYILIGGMTNVGSMYPGIIYDRMSSKDALYTGLNDANGNPMYGDGELTMIDWNIDTLGNPTARTVETRTRSAYDGVGSSDFYIALATRVNRARFGFGYMRRAYSNTYTNPDNNLSYDFQIEDILGDSLTYWRTANFSGDNISKNSENDFVLGTWIDGINISFGFSFRFDLLSTKEEAIILGDSAEYDFPEQPDTSYTNVSIYDSLMQPQSGNRMALELKSFYNYNEHAQGRFYLEFFSQSLDYGSDAMDYYFKTRQESYNYFTWDTINTVTFYEGGRNTKGLRVATKQLFDVADWLKVGIGLSFTTSSYSDSTTAQDTTVSIRVYDNGDTISGIEDYRRTVWSGDTWMTKIDGSVNSFTFPIGLEFAIAKPLVFRLGAQHTLSYNDYTTVKELIDEILQRTRYEYGDGSTSETIANPPNRPERSEEKETETTSSTNYYYGIGWQVNKNLQLDLMGFNELTDLSNWRLSVTFKFD